MAKNTVIEQVKETASEGQQKLTHNVEQVMLAGLGVVGVVQDETMKLRDETMKLRDRSEEMFEDLVKRGEKMRSEGQRALKKLVSGSRKSAEKVEDEFENRVNEALNRLSVPSRQDIDRLSAQLDVLIAKLDEKTAEPTLPIANYDELNSKEVVEAVHNLNTEALGQVLTYEVAHANRVTVTREIERLIAAKSQQEQAMEPVLA